ncbi:MAG: C25 family cysteine peptidase, partial [Candidatus Latescibacteria bacterium]|nr:C25 family cysteine peptidase [Candidatus Latescibacterota bacterium]
MSALRRCTCIGLALGIAFSQGLPATGTPATGFSPEAVQLVSSGSEELVLEVSGRDFGLAQVVVDGETYHQVDLPGGALPPNPGSPAVPVLGRFVGIPPGAQVSVEVTDGEYDEIPEVDLIPIPQTEYVGVDDEQRAVLRYARDARVYGRDEFLPDPQVLVTQTGMLRDQRVVGISLRPIQYNPARRMLRIARRLKVRVRFSAAPGITPIRRPVGAVTEPEYESVYRKTLLNAGQSRGWRIRGSEPASPLRKAALDWYDPLKTYYKVRIREDGVYRLDPSWFSDSGIDLALKDLDHLKLYLDGVEVPLDTRLGGDGRLDEGEAIVFEGRYRRAPDRDFENEFGRDNVYWMTFDGGPGLRFRAVDAAPDGSPPGSGWFTNTVHAETDSLYDPLGFAEDAFRDHWYWGRTGSPLAGMAEYPVRVPVALPGLDRSSAQQARIRVGMHGLSLLDSVDPDHRTVVRLDDGQVVSEDLWDGQTSYVASGDVPVDLLADTTWVTLATPGFEGAPEIYVDHALLNWIRVAYPRRYEAEDGGLYFQPEDSDRSTLLIDGFRNASVLVYDLLNGLTLEGAEVTQSGQSYHAQLAVDSDGARYVAVDSAALHRPELAVRDEPSNWQVDQEGAAYVILTHSSFREAADQLAVHRRSEGLAAAVVDIEDIYDEFAFGQVDPGSVRAFVAQAFSAWLQRPVYLMLFGRASYDFRDIHGEARTGRRNTVPALPFQRTRRGLAYTDHLFGTIGDDSIPDLAVGRFSVTRALEAETVVRKVVAYDQAADTRWRDRVLYMANHEPFYLGPSDSLAVRYTEPLGLESFKVY